MIKVTNGELYFGAVEAINTLVGKKLPVKTSFRLVKCVRKFNEILEDIEATKRKIADEYGLKDKEGNFIPAKDGNGKIIKDSVQFAGENKEKFEKEINELMNAETEIPEFNKINIDDLGDIVIEPSVLASLDWLFEEE